MTAGSAPPSVIDMITGSGPIVQGVLYLLILTSIASWGVVLYKAGQIRSARRGSERFVKHFITHMPNMVSSWYEGNVHEALVTASPADFTPVPRPEPVPKESGVLDEHVPLSEEDLE